MRALTLWQPWATSIAVGPKRIENRPWRFPLPMGTLIALHAGATYDREGDAFVRELWPTCPARADVPMRAVVGVARVVSQFQRSEELLFDYPPGFPNDQIDWAFGPWCWVLDDVVALDRPIEWRRGMLGLWELPAGLSETLTAVAA
jgi:hypothetical protein